MQDLVLVVGVVHRVDSTPHLLPPQDRGFFLYRRKRVSRI